MLRENPKLRPNIYQVIVEVCAMRGADVPIKDVCLIVDTTFPRLTAPRSMHTARIQKYAEIKSCLRRVPT